MGRKSTGIRERIIQESKDLFYFQGFGNTSLKEIVEKCGTNKTTFYEYFSSKDELGEIYLRNYIESENNSLNEVVNTINSPEELVKWWVDINLAELKDPDRYNACPIVGFSYQQPLAEHRWDDQLNDFTRTREGIFARFFEKCQANGYTLRYPAAHTGVLANMIEQGSLAAWKLTRKEESILNFGPLFLSLFQKDANETEKLLPKF
ncbi:TetR/AcrR family transcriptional regulator [Leptospira perolatii]|uniref:TetR/AcrR family transcriptional regulator n=1 Tax=Leptospira perolatii TaxID=2023191 RepID=UPI0013FD9BB2|nr:TetR/AcrR family transcriptional regulator [Leptospira perolatii]